MPPQLPVDHTPVVEALAAVQGEIAGLREDLRLASRPAPPPPLALVPPPPAPVRTGRVEVVVVLLLVAIAAILIALFAHASPARAQAVYPGAVPGTQQYCAAGSATPSPNTGLIPLSCGANGAANVNIISGTISGTFTPPYTANSYGQAPQTNSFLGISGYNGTGVDPIFTAPTGTTVPLGQPGAQLITGGGPLGAVPVTGSFSGTLAIGGDHTGSIPAANTGPTVVYAGAVQEQGVLITTAGTTGTETLYDNASACSGTIIGIVQGTTAVAGNVAGVLIPLNFKAVNGITGCGGTGSPAITIGLYY